MSNSIFSSSEQPLFIDTVEDKETASFNDPKTSKAKAKRVQSNVLSIIRKLIIIIIFIVILITAIVSILLGLVVVLRDCDVPHQPSTGIWLLALGGMGVLLVGAFTVVYLISATLQTKSNQVGYYIIIVIVTIILVWANALGTQGVFNLTDSTTDCLGLIYYYALALYIILVVCSIIGIGVIIYKYREKCCCKKCKTHKENKIGPSQLTTDSQIDGIQSTLSDHSALQLVPVSSIETNPVTTTIAVPTTEDKQKEATSIEQVPTDAQIDLSPMENVPI